MKAFMEALPRPRTLAGFLLSEAQFGFREGLSTVDALETVTDYIRKKTSAGQVVIAVSLNIKNTFNSLAWSVIRWSLERLPGLYS